MRELLRKFRGDRTQAEMAAMYGATQNAWSKWELGKSTPRFATMKKIEHDSGIPAEDIFFGDVNNFRELNRANNILKVVDIANMKEVS